jgi:hypothetical protein
MWPADRHVDAERLPCASQLRLIPGAVRLRLDRFCTARMRAVQLDQATSHCWGATSLSGTVIRSVYNLIIVFYSLTSF